MKKFIFAVAALAGSLFPTARAQAPFGYLPWVSELGAPRLHDLSSQSTNLSTARSAAMGGAFASLGGDLSSIHINPAGLGMYRGSEFGFTLGPTITSTLSSMSGQADAKAQRTSFGLNNAGVVFNLYNGTGPLTSFSFGVGYSRLADFNYRSSMSINSMWSLIDVFKRQADNYAASFNNKTFDQVLTMMNGYDVWYPENSYYNEWGMVLGYKAGLIEADPVEDWFIHPGLGENAMANKTLGVFSRGSAGEYAFSGGLNFQNKLYFGFSFGAMEYYQNREVTYTEALTNNTVTNPINGFRYIQTHRTTGQGWNAKLGMILRPIPELRFGLAFHTPTISTIRNEYSASIGSRVSPASEGVTEDKFYTPARLLTGVSFALADYGVLSLDYELAFTGSMGVRSTDYTQSYKDDLRASVKDNFGNSNTLRLGLETRATDILYLRFGYVHSDHGVKKDRTPVSPVVFNSDTFSTGFGVRINPHVSLDMTYSCNLAKLTGYDMFYMDGATPIFAGTSIDDRVHSRQQRHNILLGMSFRF